MASFSVLLPRDIDLAHIDHAGQVEERTHRRRRHAMLAGPGLRDDAALAHALGQQDLAHAVVDLVGAGVVQLVALEVDLGAAEMPGQPLGEIERARPPDIVLVIVAKLGRKARVVLGRLIGALHLEDQRHQRFRHEPAAIKAEMAALVGTGAIGVDLGQGVEIRRLPA
jgi:hypothetical protein